MIINRLLETYEAFLPWTIFRSRTSWCPSWCLVKFGLAACARKPAVMYYYAGFRWLAFCNSRLANRLDSATHQRGSTGPGTKLLYVIALLSLKKYYFINVSPVCFHACRQVHYYEEGNVQLVCSKEINQTVNVTVSASKTTSPGFSFYCTMLC